MYTAITSIFHFIHFLIIESTPEFYTILDNFDSSPLFNFRIADDCYPDGRIIFQNWKGIKEYYTDSSNNQATRIVYETHITKINGKVYCYKKISYKDLLSNGQIIKKEEICPLNYTKDCGTIDTLEQKLCIEDNEECPLYDINFELNIFDNINNDKKIIGKLILNEGQPCYRINEVLWRKFYKEEVYDTHLKCDLEVFGKFNDDRYIKKENIYYQKLYEDNLPSKIKDKIINEIKNNETVSLYKREFLGIDKKCHEKSNISREKIKGIKDNKDNEIVVLFLEGIFMFIVNLAFIIYDAIMRAMRGVDEEEYIKSVLKHSITNGIIFFIFIIIQSVFIGRIIANLFDGYNCSDSTTNELINQEYKKLKSTIMLLYIDLGLDVFGLILCIFLICLNHCLEDCDPNFCCRKRSNYLQPLYPAKNGDENVDSEEEVKKSEEESKEEGKKENKEEDCSSDNSLVINH